MSIYLDVPLFYYVEQIFVFLPAYVCSFSCLFSSILLKSLKKLISFACSVALSPTLIVLISLPYNSWGTDGHYIIRILIFIVKASSSAILSWEVTGLSWELLSLTLREPCNWTRWIFFWDSVHPETRKASHRGTELPQESLMRWFHEIGSLYNWFSQSFLIWSKLSTLYSAPKY